MRHAHASSALTRTVASVFVVVGVVARARVGIDAVDDRSSSNALKVFANNRSTDTFEVTANERTSSRTIASEFTTSRGASSTTRATFLTYSDRATDGACLGLETASSRGIDLKVIGVDGDGGRFDFSHITNVKTKKLHAWLRVMNDEELRGEYGVKDDGTLVALADATDVLYLQSSDEVVRKYLAIVSFVKPDKALIVVSAERNCWPYMDGSREIQPGGRERCAKFPDGGGSTYKYLNSGSMIGPAKAIAAMLRDVQAAMKTVNDDDQGCLQEAYMRQIEGHGSSEYTIALDHKQSLFQTGWGSRLETSSYALYEPKGAYYNTTRGVVVNTEHEVEPAMVHFNGGKPAHLPLARHFVKFHARDNKTTTEAHERLKSQYPWFETKCASVLEFR